MTSYGEEDALAQPSSSTLRATPTQQTRRLQQRKSHSPYPKSSPRTPIRRAADQSSTVSVTASQQKSPQSPSMRAFSAIVGLLTPFGSRQAKNSAAFGDPDQTVEYEEGEEDQTGDFGGDEEAVQTIYPPLPSAQLQTPSTAVDTPEQTHAQPDLFSSSGFSIPRHSTPSKTGFGALAASAPRTELPPAVSAFTFGNSDLAAESLTPALPAYPRTSSKQRPHLSSPLAKNYDLLARFFAEKAEQEAREDGASSAASLYNEETGGEVEGGLTEIEVAGCMRLIEESLAQGRRSELERLRGDALENTNLDPVTPYSNDSRYKRQSIMSRSPSLPLGAAAGEMPVGYRLQSRPSSSFLSPSLLRSDDAKVNRSLATTFGPNSAPAKRRHRPLYLGPGQSASATSTLAKRNQQLQQRKSMINRAAPTVRLQAAPSRHREDADVEDRDASGSNVKRRRMQEAESATIQEKEQSTSLSASQSLPSFSFHAPPATASPSTPIPSRQIREEAKLTPSRTATADAMLSILSSGPSIPVRRSTPASKGASLDQESSPSPAHSDIVNPYQTRSRLSKQSKSGVGSSNLATKEKERLREERDKKQKMMEDLKKKKQESTLEMIERTAPKESSKRGARKIRVEEKEEEQQSRDVDRETKKKEKEQQKQKAEAEAAATAGEKEKKSKKRMELEGEAEEKKRAEEQEKQKRKQEVDEERRKKTEEVKKRMEKLASQTTSSTSDSEPAAGTSTPAPSSTARKSFSFGTSFAPKKPSPLSQANIVAPDSPSSSSEASDREAVVKPFSFSTPSNGIGAYSSSTPVQNSREESINVPLTSSFKSTSASPRRLALDLPVTSLPKFDFALDFVLPDSSTAPNQQSRMIAKEKASTDLPSFDFFKERNGAPAAAAAAAGAEAINGAEPASSKSAPLVFSFGASAAPAKAADPEASDTSPAPKEADSAKPSSDSTLSALLSGTGEGEEDEECLHEVRSKVWNLKEGKWNDMGIGLFKVKRNKGDNKKRILVRNEGNGKVMVNFRLAAGFKPIKDKNVVSFLGFDAEGKPINYRCKIKTNEWADELANVLEREAAAAAAAQ